MCGVGNVYRCEVLWAIELSPFARVGTLTEHDAIRLVNTAATMLRSNLTTSRRVTAPGLRGGLAVYGRNGQRCARCGATIECRQIGEQRGPCTGARAARRISIRTWNARPTTRRWIRIRRPSAGSPTSPGTATPAERHRSTFASGFPPASRRKSRRKRGSDPSEGSGQARPRMRSTSISITTPIVAVLRRAVPRGVTVDAGGTPSGSVTRRTTPSSASHRPPSTWHTAPAAGGLHPRRVLGLLRSRPRDHTDDPPLDVVAEADGHHVR